MAKQRKHSLNSMELSGFCTEIALMLGAGMPLHDGMNALKQSHGSDGRGSLYEGLSNAVMETGSLYQALKQTGAWPGYLTEMCGIGERTGHLEEVMEGLGEYYERESRMRYAVRNAVTYPLVLSVMMALIVLVMMFKILPVFRRVLGSMGMVMTDSGSVMMRLGSAIGWAVFSLVVIAALAAVVCLLLLRTSKRERALNMLKNLLPPLRRVGRRIASARVASVLSMMLSSGFPLDEALTLAPSVLEDRAAADALDGVRQRIAQGVAFSEALTDAGLFDEVHNQMIRMGAAAGREDQVMAKIAHVYEEQVEDGVAGLVSIIEPTMVALLCIVVGAILLSVMLPMAGIISSIL